MSAEYVSSSSVDFGNRTNTTIPEPADTVNDNGLCILHIVGGNGVPPEATEPDGFVPVANFPVLYSDGTPGVNFTYRVNCWVKIADGETGDYVVLHDAGFSTAFMENMSGIDIADLVAPTPTVATGSGDPTTIPGVTTPRDNALVLLWCACWELFNGGTDPPAPFIERYDGASTLYVATATIATAGPTGDQILDLPPGGGAGVARGMISFQPSVSGGGGGGVDSIYMEMIS